MTRLTQYKGRALRCMYQYQSLHRSEVGIHTSATSGYVSLTSLDGWEGPSTKKHPDTEWLLFGCTTNSGLYAMIHVKMEISSQATEETGSP